MGKQIALALLAVALAYGGGAATHSALNPTAERKDKLTCPTAIHLVECAECPSVTAQVVVNVIEQSKKQQGVSPVTSRP